MAYTVYLGTFDKRINSTKRPTLLQYQAWDSYDVTLKEVTSYDHPTLLLKAEFATVANQHYNYAVMFGRWYWVTDLRAVRTNVIEIDLSLDMLATFQGAIKNTKAFIEYGFNTTDAGSSATRIADNRRAISKNPVVASASASLIGAALSTSGSYILQCVGADNGVSCYAVTYTQLQAMMLSLSQDIDNGINIILSNVDPTDQAGTIATLVELMGAGYKNSLLAESALSAIKSIHWLPLSWNAISGTSTLIYLGKYSTGQYGKRLNTNELWTNTVSLNIPWQASDWRRCNTQISLYVPFFGTVPVPVDQCINQGSISATLSLDVLGGDLSVRITCGSQTIYTGSTNVAAPYAVGVSAVSMGSKISGGIQIAGAGLTMADGALDIGAGIAGIAATGGLWGGKKITGGMQEILSAGSQALAGYAQTVQPLITSAGSMGGIAALGQSTDLTLTLLYWPAITDTDFDAIYGHPVFKVDTPANGFCKTRGFSISLGNEATYAAFINSAMDGGVFIED